jgi:predicted ATPase
MVSPHQGHYRNEGPPGDDIIHTPDRRLRVFVSSTLGELADERQAVARAVSALRLTPVMFESGARPHPPQDVYRAYVAQSDVFVGLYWQQYGWVGPGMEVSGLEEELELSRSLPRLVYVKGPAPDREPRLAELLVRITDEASISYRRFRTSAELGRLVRDDLATLLSERFAAFVATGGPELASSSAAIRRGPRPLPVGTTSLIGREQDVEKVAGLFGRPDVRLVTLTGPGGVGKTRLAVAAAERLRDRFPATTAFVPLVAITRPELVVAGIARAAGTNLAGTSAPLEALAEQLAEDQWLLVLDNLEHVIEVASDIGELLTRCPGVTILATSRTVLGLRAEREYPVLPLMLPADPRGLSLAEVASSPAVAMFVDRARAVQYDFALTDGNAAAVVEICRRLEGLPLAIELAAARIRLLDPAALLDRLVSSFDTLGTGPVDLPERQRTLRATVEWSVGLLDDAERSLLETVAAFVDGWTVDAAAQVADLDEDRALELSETLARHGLVQLDHTELGPRARMLETVRAFVTERLAARPDLTEIQRRHAAYYRALAERADRSLRGVDNRGTLERLQAEASNLAVAVEWYLGHERAPLPNLFRVLLLFWEQRDHVSEARAWVDLLLPTADALDPQDRAELLWTAQVIANQLGDDPAALWARERLEPLLDQIADPYLQAVSWLAMAWTSPIVGDFDGALREASASLAQLRGLNEPYWLVVAVLTTGTLERILGRNDDALGHLREGLDLAERFDDAWPAAWSRVALGVLDVARGQLTDAGALLDEGLDLSLAAHSTLVVTSCLAAFARLALAGGDAERAALLAGAAEGLRRRVGLQAWPIMRREEAELVALVRETLGASRFDQMFATGGRLSQQQAVAALRDPRGAAPQPTE